MEYVYKHLHRSDVELLKQLLTVFGEVFQDRATYQGAVPSDDYLSSLLAGPVFISLVALYGQQVIGGLAAYVLEKFEQNRREIYIYDLAIAEPHRRKGVATQLIRELQRIAKERRASVIFVQADQDDGPAIQLYETLGTKENVLHFDIPVDTSH